MLVTRTSRLTILGLALLFEIFMVSSSRADQPRFTTIDVPGASFTYASGINPAGVIVGFSNASGHGFLLSEGAFTTIAAPRSPFPHHSYWDQPQRRHRGNLL